MVYFSDSMTGEIKVDHPIGVQDRGKAKGVAFQGEFWKPCPGTCGGYHCCGYQILTPQQGCGMYCRFCILQVYFEHRHPQLFTNLEEMEAEVARKMAAWSGVVRFGTGEFTDSLFGESESGISRKIGAILEPYDNAIVEFKTKSAHVGTLGSIKRPQRVVVGFSVNTPRMIAEHEKGTASLSERLSAAAQCEAMGFHVAFHFDPMFWYQGWKTEYRSVVEAIYSHVKDPGTIAWVSLGGFRTNPALKRHLRSAGRHLPLFSGEMITGSDGKIRYLRPYRIALYRAMQDAFEHHAPGNATLYLCMESPEVWEAAGMAWRIPQGLPAYLDNRAKEILGLA